MDQILCFFYALKFRALAPSTIEPHLNSFSPCSGRVICYSTRALQSVCSNY